MTSDQNQEPPVVQRLSEDELAARKKRNLWLALSLVGFVALVLMVTFVRLSQTTVMPDGGF